MKFECKINNHDIAQYIKEDGVQFTVDKRNEKSVVTASGRLVKRQNSKTIVNISFRDMDDKYYTLLKTYFLPNPVQFYYSDFVNTPINKTFYADFGSVGVSKVLADSISIIKGFSVDLTEKG